MDLNYELEPITRENLYDYRRLILPDVLPELAGIPDDDVAGAVLCGARLDGEPCGAVVCSLIGRELFIVSIFVVPALRRNGIGNGLLEYACAMALGEEEKTGNYQQLQVNCEYSLPEPEASEFKSFLRSFGFNNFTGEHPVYSVRPEHYTGSVSVIALTELSGDDRNTILAINEESDMVIVPEISFTDKEGDDSRLLFFTQDLGDNTYLAATEAEIDVSLEEYEEFVRSATSRILDYDPKATVLLRDEDTPYASVWETLAECSGEVCDHVTATAYRVYFDE